jgi:prevent-host-death family protein
MKQARIAELKAHLSAYIAEVRNGETVIVCDRSRPVARLIPYEEGDDLEVVEASEPPRNAKKIKPVKVPRRVNIDRILAETRSER